MQQAKSRLTVYFDDPFWVGVYERISDGELKVCKITFGAQPKDYEVYGFLLRNWSSLRFSPPVNPAGTRGAPEKRANPKRLQRAITKQLAAQGVGTKAQQALKLQQQEGKALRRQKSHLQKQDEKQRQFELRQQKKKEKHRGR